MIMNSNYTIIQDILWLNKASMYRFTKSTFLNSQNVFLNTGLSILTIMSQCLLSSWGTCIDVNCTMIYNQKSEWKWWGGSTEVGSQKDTHPSHMTSAHLMNWSKYKSLVKMGYLCQGHYKQMFSKSLKWCSINIYIMLQIHIEWISNSKSHEMKQI